MSERGELLFSCRGFRTIAQLVLESLLMFVMGVSLFVSLIKVESLLVAIVSGYLLYRLRTGWHRKKIEVWSRGLVIGKEFIPWNNIKDIEVMGSRIEAGLVIGDTILSYEEVGDVVVWLSDRKIKFRLKRGDLDRFVKAVEQARQ